MSVRHRGRDRERCCEWVLQGKASIPSGGVVPHGHAHASPDSQWVCCRAKQAYLAEAWFLTATRMHPLIPSGCAAGQSKHT
jgi:hypothetical protein